MSKRQTHDRAEDDERERDAAYRQVCTAFKFWRRCGAECRRAHACAGAPVECLHRNWQRVDEASKIHFRTAIKARAAGHSVAEAVRMGEEQVARYADHIARVDAQTIAALEANDAAAQAGQSHAEPAPHPAAPISSVQPPSPRCAEQGKESAPRVRGL